MQYTTQLPIDAATMRLLVDAVVSDRATNYEKVVASQTAQVLGSTGAVGDILARLVIIPASISPGSVALLDNATSTTVFPGGASSLSNLQPFTIHIGAASLSGAWKITTGANVTVIAIGKFT
jgi:hypothetical protein